ncbi:hypothetical protein [Bizionia arctica]|uniref:Uncharacterized protein n=1 Tax=Bizionia arctica TaxID=1495645 RepID=A0A917LVN4_9FLAO|nr:hypothetical protein [Bizionia arctica]GGG60569.1 hypothetical protein GCM10010976_34160 [Bizionia arctica]
MKIFPIKKYSITLITECSKAISELKKETLSDGQFVSNWNKQTFIGVINNSDFEIKLSKKLYGGFCVLKGKLEKENGIIEIEINKTLKIILLTLFLFPIFGFLISLIQNGFKNSTELLLPTLMFIIILRFGFIELGFRIISKKGLKELTEIIGIEKIKNVAQHCV